MNDKYLTILLYHGVTANKQSGVANFSGKHINTKIFEDQISFIKKNCNILSMDEIVEIYNSGNDWPSNAVAVTFDDGFQNNYLNAVPILDFYSVPATFYVCAGMVNTDLMFWVDIIEDCINRTKVKILKNSINGLTTFKLNSENDKINAINEIKKYCKFSSSEKKNLIIQELIHETSIEPSVEASSDYKMMTWDELKVLNNNSLFTIGGHTLYHDIMTSLKIDKIKANTDATIALINFNLNQKTIHYSYPEGQKNHYNEDIISMLIEKGIVCSPSAIDGVNFNENLFNLKRIMPSFMNREFPFKL